MKGGLHVQEVERKEWKKADKRGARCWVYILDLSEVAVQQGLPRCWEDDYVTDLSQSLVLPHPASTGWPVPQKSLPDHDVMYPFSFGSHQAAQTSGPWCAVATPSPSLLSSLPVHCPTKAMLFVPLDPLITLLLLNCQSICGETPALKRPHQHHVLPLLLPSNGNEEP